MKTAGRPPPSQKAASSARTDWAAIRSRLGAARDALDRVWATERDEAERILRSRARALARPAATPPEGDAIDVLEFGLAGEAYAIEPRHVREVLPLATLVALPGVPDVVRGVANVRGEILSVVDLRRLFGLPGHGLGELDYAVVLHSPSMSFAILADAIVGLRRLPRSTIRAALPTLDGARADYLLGVTGESTAVLDGERLLADAMRLAGEAGPEREAAPANEPPDSPRREGTNEEGEA